MEQDRYRMKMLNIDKLPDKANAKTIKEMIEADKYRWREAGKTKQETKDIVRKKLLGAYVVTGEEPYYHAYSLLHRFMSRQR